MTVEAMTRRSLELLARGHDLYAGDPAVAAVDTAERLHDHADRLATVTAHPGCPPAAARSRQLAGDLRGTAAADAELTRLLSAAHADREWGRTRTRAVLDDALADRAPAADTPVGRREAARRMAGRLRTQRRHIHASRRHSGQLARRMQAIPLTALRYHRVTAHGDVAHHIAAALDRLGIYDPHARHRWLRGYATLIARESTGRPSAVASEPATAPGPIQGDGYRLGYARGLTQTIPTTFAQYHQQGTSTNIYDPVANICASMNYVMHRYGVSPDGSNLAALVQQADSRRPPKGY